MPALQNLSVLDRAATPLAHVFVPRSLESNVGTLVEVTGVPVGERMFTISLRKVGAKYRGRLVLKNPVIVNETINGVVVPRVARTAFVSMDITFDETSSLQERKDTIGMFADALAAAKVVVNDSFVNLEGLF
jgi:hypothetical protein